MALQTGSKIRQSLCPMAVAALLASALPAGLLLIGCSSKFALVKAAQADMQPITRTVDTNGKAELTQDFQAHATSSGQVKQLLVKVGDRVQAGQLLIQIDDADARMRISNANFALQSAQNGVTTLRNGGNADELLGSKADMTAAQLNLQQARTRLNTLQQLQSSGQSSANEVAAAQTQVTEAQNRINALQARQGGRFSPGDLALQQNQVARSRAELAAAQASLGSLDIRAPFAGTVYGVPVIRYATVNPGEDLVNLADLTNIRVRAFFDEPEIGRLHIGQAVSIDWEAKPDRTWHGHIAQTPTSITSYGTRNVGECLITIDDARGDLLPNVTVTVHVTTIHRDSVLAIPREALRTDGANNYVYKIVDGKLQRTPVQVDPVSLNPVSAQIKSGLQAGDTVVRVPMNDVELKDGIPVKVQP